MTPRPSWMRYLCVGKEDFAAKMRDRREKEIYIEVEKVEHVHEVVGGVHFFFVCY